MSRSPARPEEAEQYCPEVMIRQCRHPTFEEYDITASDSIHSLACIPRVHTSGLQTHLHQEASHCSPQKDPQITMPDWSNARASDTQHTLVVPPVPAPDFEEGTESSIYYPPSGEANAAIQYTPDDALSQAERQSEGEENLESTGSDGDEDCNGGERTKVERLAEKRKMKRFRLTHAQTQYLLGEFARQAHPDANQRERLSRDIAGLSPRQVQVWFQNRRAKLKRLTTDDQERMIRFRVQPEDFNFTHTLQTAYEAQRPSCEPVASLSDLSWIDAGKRPILTSRQDPQIPCPTNNPPVTNMSHIGGSASASFSLSPVSSLNKGSYDGLQYSTSAYSVNGSPTIVPQSRAELARSDSLSTSLIWQGRNDTIQQGNVNQFSAVSLATPMNPSGKTFVDSPYGYGRTPSRSSPAPLDDQSINRRVSPHVSPINTSPNCEQSSAQFSPATGSAGFPWNSVSYTGHVNMHMSQSGQSGRLVQSGQLRRPLDRTMNPFQPPASSNRYPLHGNNMVDASLLGQQRFYTELGV